MAIDMAAARRLQLEWERHGGLTDDPQRIGFHDLAAFCQAWGAMVDHSGLPPPIGPHTMIARG